MLDNVDPAAICGKNHGSTRPRSLTIRLATGYKRYVLDAQELHALLNSAGALLDGHFVLSSGLHSARYLQCAKLLEDPRRAELLGAAIARKFDGQMLDVVASPALGAVLIGHEVARAAGCRFIFAERVEGAATFRRGFQLNPGERAVVVEDVITTGGSTREVVELLRAVRVDIRGVAAIIDRSGGQAEFNVPLVSLLQLDVPTWKPENCPLCKQGVPTEKPGSRK